MPKTIFFTFILCTSLAFGQTNFKKIDSLKSNINESIDAQTLLQINEQIGKEFLNGQIYLDSSLYYLQKAIDISKNNNLEKEQAKLFFYTAKSFGIAENWDKSIAYFKKSIIVSEKFNLKHGTIAAYNNLGYIFMKTNQLEKAKNIYKKTIQLAKLDNNLYLEAFALTDLAEIYYKGKKYSKALKTIDEAKVLFIETDLISHQAFTISGKIYFALKNIEEAKKDGLIAEQKAMDNSDLEYIFQTSYLLSKIYERENNYARSNSYLKKALKYKDSIFNSKNNNQIGKMELKVKILQQEAEVKNLKQKNNYLITIYILGSIGILLLVLLIFRQLKIVRMTKSIHDVQHSLIKHELDKRKEKQTTLFSAIKKGDDSLLKKQSH